MIKTTVKKECRYLDCLLECSSLWWSGFRAEVVLVSTSWSIWSDTKVQVDGGMVQYSVCRETSSQENKEDLHPSVRTPPELCNSSFQEFTHV
uniref:Uncharacterized protein n=1 Tax=Vespula pensylvanica TaxID=30213 RepID=A0A834PEV6_VESPE|nr:hypothetical protein H0235_000929 [Vespula pensylvanica]